MAKNKDSGGMDSEKKPAPTGNPGTRSGKIKGNIKKAPKNAHTGNYGTYWEKRMKKRS